ncbi:MAG: DUF1569 domain-containing protein [Acidobacteriota bacterium]
MKSLLNESDRKELIDRLNRFSSDQRPSWGKMDAKQMITHLVDSLRMSAGELQPAPKKSILSNSLIKRFVIHYWPMPKNVHTAPELIARKADNIDIEKTQLANLIQKYKEFEQREAWPDHPIFGKMSNKDWGVLCYKHIDHHFRQFKI